MKINFIIPVDKYSDGNTRTMYEICLKSTINTPERCIKDVAIVDFERAYAGRDAKKHRTHIAIQLFVVNNFKDFYFQLSGERIKKV